MEIILWSLAVALSVPVLVFVVECLLGLAPLRTGVPMVDPPPFAVLVPAHDEADGIAATLAAIRAQLRVCDRLVVVADNCSDATARIALRAGAEVVERFDLQKRGKGFAVAAGRAHLVDDPPAVVVVMDADCRPGPGALRQLAAEAAGTGAAVQALYLLEPSARSGPMVELSSFAFLVKNLVRQRGLCRLGTPAPLHGTGMAFPWTLFAAAPLASASIVEDLALGLDLALAGENVRFTEAAAVISPASSGAATVTQRTRWEHGMIGTARGYLPRLLRTGLAGRPRLLPLALDLIVPPLALLGLLLAGGTGVALLAVAAAGPGPLLWLLGMDGLLALAIALVWGCEGQRCLRFATLMRVPQYLLWKLPIYAGLLRAPERSWVRTSREG